MGGGRSVGAGSSSSSSERSLVASPTGAGPRPLVPFFVGRSAARSAIHRAWLSLKRRSDSAAMASSSLACVSLANCSAAFFAARPSSAARRAVSCAFFAAKMEASSFCAASKCGFDLASACLQKDAWTLVRLASKPNSAWLPSA